MNKFVIRGENSNTRKTIFGEAELEILSNGTWKKVGSVKDNKTTDITFSFPAADVSGIRFSVDKAATKSSSVHIDEVEAYLVK